MMMGQEQEVGTVLHFVMASLRMTNQRMKTVMRVTVSDLLKTIPKVKWRLKDYFSSVSYFK